MSERDNDTGQFTPAEPLTGNEGILADAGYVPMDEPQDHPEAESDLRTEAARLAESRMQADPVIDLGYRQTSDGEPTPQNKTVSLEKAASDLSTYHEALDEVAAGTADADIASYVDGLRGELLGEDPEKAEALAKDLGLSAEELAAAKAAKAEEASPSETNDAARAEMAKPAADDPYADIPGLDEPTRQAMKVPQIREAVEKEFTKAAETQQAYTTGLNNAQQFGQAAILALAPELAQVPLERWGEGINILAQSDPARGQQLAQMFSNVAALNERQQLISHHQQQVAHQQFETLRQQYAQQSDKVLGMSNNEKAQMAEDLVSYLGEHGVSRDQLMQEARTNLLVHHPAFNALAKDALKYRAMQKAAKPVAQKDLPPVTRPGTSVHRGSSDNSSQIASLQKQISSLTGDKAVRAAAKLAQLQRKTG